MILTLTLNPAIDLTYTLTALHPGSSHRVPEPWQRAGGKGVNVARVLTEQGHQAMVLAPAGGTTGIQFRQDLDAAGLRHHLTEVTGPTRRTVTVATPEHATALNEAGQAPAPAELAELLGTLGAELAGARVLVCSGSTPAGSPPDLIPRVVHLAHEAGVPVIVDTSGPALLAAADAGADVLKPNHHELAEITGLTPTQSTDLDHVVPAARVLAGRSGGLVFASLGAAGMVASSATGPAWHARLAEPLAGNPTGAGDAAVAAIAVALARHGADLSEGPLPDTLQVATAWSAAAVLTPSAGSIADPGSLTEQIIMSQLDI